jgi:PAS domain S-box-containing protein/diguanylate cyclase (GGDEF)-like protein
MLVRQDAGQAPLFEIAAEVATMLRGVRDWSEAAPEALARIGAGMGLHRAFVFQVHELPDDGGGGRLAQTCRYDWAVAGLAPLTGEPTTTDEDLTNADEPMMRLAQRRRRGEVAHGLARDVEGRLRAELDRQRIRAFLSVPLTVSGRWWGHVGFADCELERQWSPSEISAARLFGELFAAAIERSTGSLVADAMSRASMLNAAFDAIVTVDEVEHISEFNPAAEALFGLSRAEVLGRPLSTMIVVEPAEAGERLTIRGLAAAPGAGSPREIVMRRADGTAFPVEISATEVRTEERRFFTAHLRDVTERRRTIEALAASEAQFRALVEDQSDLVTLWDADFHVTFENRAFRENFGVNFDQEGRRHASATIPPDVWERLLPALLALTPDQPIFRSENRKYPRSGEERLYAWTNRALFDEAGTVTGYLSVGRDVTEQRRLERALEGLAYVDAATGLPNRNAVLQRFPSWEVSDNGYDTVVAVRLREFGEITASFGHAFSDRLMAAAAKRLQAVMEGRSALARVGENWFAVLSRSSQDGALALAQRLREAFVQPFELEGRRVPLGASFGIARRTGAIERLLEDAEIAGQSDRPGAINRFDAAVRTRHLERLEIEADLRDALTHRRPEIDAAFQPIFDLASNALVGFEALARWRHPERGAVPPSVFVPIAEATGLILPLGERVLDLAAGCCARWLERRVRQGRKPVYVSVNLSAHQIADPDLAERIAAIVAQHQTDAGALAFEITEGTLMSKSDHVVGVLRRLKKLGASLAIDDFGTGYSSFGYLHQFPIDSLKIDRSFVSGMTRSSNNREIVRAMIELGHGLGLMVVAEGIEEWETRDALLDLGCDHGQGFLLGRPMTPEDADAVVEMSLTVA